MVSGIPADMALALFAVSATAAFFLGNAMNSVLGPQGFGPWGNMIILLAGFLIGLDAVGRLPYRSLPPEYLVPAAVGFAFAVLFGLAVIKLLIRKV